RRSLVVGLVDQKPVAAVGFELVPRPREFRWIALRAVVRQKLGLLLDPRGNEIFAGLLEDRTALVAVGLQQGIAAPPLQRSGELPAEVGHVLKTIVETEAAIGRMTVRRVPRDEHTSDLIRLRHRNPQIPEPDVVELAGKLETGDALDEP